MVIMMAGIIFTEPDVDVDADAVLMLMQNYCQEPPHIWRMSSFLLRSLIMVFMSGVIFTEPEVSVDVNADADADDDAELRGGEVKMVVRNLPILGGHPPSS